MDLEKLNQLSGLGSFLIAIVVAVLGWVATPDHVKKKFYRAVIALVQMIIFLGGVYYIYTFATTPGTPTRTEISMFATWIFNVLMIVNMTAKRFTSQ